MASAPDRSAAGDSKEISLTLVHVDRGLSHSKYIVCSVTSLAVTTVLCSSIREIFSYAQVLNHCVLLLSVLYDEKAKFLDHLC